MGETPARRPAFQRVFGIRGTCLPLALGAVTFLGMRLCSVLLSGLACVPLRAQDPPPLPFVLPQADLVFHVMGIEEIRPRHRRDASFAVFRTPESAALWRAVRTWAEESAGYGDALGGLLGTADLRVLLDGFERLKGGVTCSLRVGKTGGEQPKPALAILLSLDPRPYQPGKLLAEMQKRAGRLGEGELVELAGRPARRYQQNFAAAPIPGWKWVLYPGFQHQDQIVLAWGSDAGFLHGQLQATLAGKADQDLRRSLAGSSMHFRMSMGRLLRAATDDAMLGGLLPVKPQDMLFGSALDGMGVLDLGDLVIDYRGDPESGRSTMDSVIDLGALSSDLKRALLPPAGRTSSLQDLVPFSRQDAYFMYLDVSRLPKALRPAMQVVLDIPDPDQAWEQVKSMFEGRFRMDLEKDLLAHIGSDWIVVGHVDFRREIEAVENGDGFEDVELGPDDEAVFGVSLKNPQAFAKALDRIIRGMGLHPSRRRWEYGGQTCYRIQNVALPFAFYYAVTGRCCYFGVDEGGKASIEALIDAENRSAQGKPAVWPQHLDTLRQKSWRDAYGLGFVRSAQIAGEFLKLERSLKKHKAGELWDWMSGGEIGLLGPEFDRVLTLGFRATLAAMREVARFGDAADTLRVLRYVGTRIEYRER